ncbi:MAG: hypothetical protein ABIR34_05830 [Marmoricola sp.]
MSDEAETDAHIRALLAELGSGPDGESMPPEVAARLDDTLARLQAERETAGDPAGEETDRSKASPTVVPLRRRWATRVTAAAAAVIVIGAGGVAAANLGVLGGSSSDSKVASGGGGSAADSAPEAVAPTPSGREPANGGVPQLARSLPRVRSTAFAADVTGLVKRRTGVVAPNPGAESQYDQGKSGESQDTAGDRAAEQRSPAAALTSLSCPGPHITDGAVPSPIEYDGRVAVLVVHRVSDGKQLVEAWTCKGKRKLDSATITP